MRTNTAVTPPQADDVGSQPSAERRVRPASGLTGRLAQKARGPALALLSLGVVVLLWELVTLLADVRPSLFPRPLDVLRAAQQMWNEGVLLKDMEISLRRALIGFLIGAALGVVLGLLTGRVRAVRIALEPLLTVLRPIPAIALVPVAIVWFGIGEESKYFVVAYAVLLAVWLNTHAGAAGIPDAYIKAGQSLGVSRRRMFAEIVLPAAAPFIVAGLRLGAAVAFLSLVAAELSGASSGIGYRLQEARQFLDTSSMFVGLIELGLLGAVLDWVFVKCQRKFIHWESS